MNPSKTFDGKDNPAGAFKILHDLGFQQQDRWLRIDQQVLAEMYEELHKRDPKVSDEERDWPLMDAPAIGDICVYCRKSCGLALGGDVYPAIGATHFWQNSTSCYALLYFSPQNDWLQIMVVRGPAPNPALEAPETQ